jgi:DNA-binding LacI/PurR family transcriptional regulator
LQKAYSAAGLSAAVSVYTSPGSMADWPKYRAEMEQMHSDAALRDAHRRWQAKAPDVLRKHVDWLLSDSLSDAYATACVHATVNTLCERALADGSATAWVFPNDYICGMGYDLLRAKHIQVPRRISLVGFDDSTAAVYRRITSYYFNLPALVKAMLRHVLTPHVLHGVRRRRVIEIEGNIVERQTTAAPGHG